MADSSSSTVSDEYKKTLENYAEFSSDMSTVSDDWQACKQLIEAYNEQQVSPLLECIVYIPH